MIKVLSRPPDKMQSKKISTSTTQPEDCSVHSHLPPLFFPPSLSKFKDLEASAALVRVLHARGIRYKTSYTVFCSPVLTSNTLSYPKA